MSGDITAAVTVELHKGFLEKLGMICWLLGVSLFKQKKCSAFLRPHPDPFRHFSGSRRQILK